MDPFEKYHSEIELFVGVCHTLARRLYVTGSGGNLAWKLEDALILITPTQMNKGDIQPDDLVFIRPDGEIVAGRRRPTGEMPMYLKFFGERPDIVSVLHCHPPSVCAMAILKGKNWLMRPIYPETITEIGPLPLVPYAEPLTAELAQNFSPYIRRYNSFLMENHGLVTLCRDTIRAALLNVELLEVTAQSLLLALAAGEVKELNREAVRRLDNVMRVRNLPFVGLPGVNHSLEELYFDDGIVQETTDGSSSRRS